MSCSLQPLRSRCSRLSIILLDGLTPPEYWTIYQVVRDAGHIQEKTIIISLLMNEPPKAEVLAWKPGEPMPRTATMVLMTEQKPYAAVVDITAKKVISFEEIKGDQPTLTDEERHAVEEEIKHDPRLIAALKKRGITDLGRLHAMWNLPAMWRSPSRSMGHVSAGGHVRTWKAPPACGTARLAASFSSWT